MRFPSVSLPRGNKSFSSGGGRGRVRLYPGRMPLRRAGGAAGSQMPPRRRVCEIGFRCAMLSATKADSSVSASRHVETRRMSVLFKHVKIEFSFALDAADGLECDGLLAVLALPRNGHRVAFD